MGFLPVGDTFANATWLANPILFAAWYAAVTGKKTRATLLSFAAFVLGCTFMLGHTVVTNEGGVPADITGYRIGYWLWVTSMAIAVIAALFSRLPIAQPSSDPQA
jgi:hypothetical protein